jgi:RimJ/RimL family protein N-acetyltransferase
MPSIVLKPLQQSDLKLLVAWFALPHVREWWPDNLSAEQIAAKYCARIGSKDIVPMLIYADGKPIGFIQYCRATKEEWPDEPEGTIGLDLFIGESDYLGKGYGTTAIQTLITQLLTNPTVKRIIIDVDPNNTRAIRSYEKAGFKFVKTVTTPDGVANLMEFKQAGSHYEQSPFSGE